ncbi:MAG: (d)CMP kinase [Acidobacteriota bacterium]
MPRRRFVVAIDGPAGAGKSAAARELARRLGIPYLDTGAMYRAVALAALEQGIAFPLDEDGRRRVVELARMLHLRFVTKSSETIVICNGEDVTGRLRSPEVSQAASQVSVVPELRRVLVARQREMGQRGGGVIEGRDIGTVVFPEADLKVFLTARPEVRAQRRFDELRRRGVAVAWEDVMAEQRQRDERDASREESPLRPAAGAIVLDTSDLTLEEVVGRLAELAARAGLPLDRSTLAHL